MFTGGFGSYSVDDVAAAQRFYGETLGLAVTERMGGLEYELNGLRVFVYPKDGHQPASFTVVNFTVEDIDAAVDQLEQRGIALLRYDNLPAQQDERGILRGGKATGAPDIAWFTDPAGNILSVIRVETM